MASLIVVLLAQLAVPNLTLTPGVVRPLSITQVCTTKWSLDIRHVTRKMRQQAFVAAGVLWESRATYVVDHKVPRQLAGADTMLNLQVQEKRASYRKDAEEGRLYRAVCRGTVTLTEAQRQMWQWGR